MSEGLITVAFEYKDKPYPIKIEMHLSKYKSFCGWRKSKDRIGTVYVTKTSNNEVPIFINIEGLLAAYQVDGVIWVGSNKKDVEENQIDGDQ
jgi:hypothetical protein